MKPKCNNTITEYIHDIYMIYTLTALAMFFPWGLNPPRTLMAWGVSPTCPITAIPASTIALAAVILDGAPPSNLIASIPPSLRTRTAVSTACSQFKLQTSPHYCTFFQPLKSTEDYAEISLPQNKYSKENQHLNTPLKLKHIPYEYHKTLPNHPLSVPNLYLATNI